MKTSDIIPPLFVTIVFLYGAWGTLKGNDIKDIYYGKNNEGGWPSKFMSYPQWEKMQKTLAWVSLAFLLVFWLIWLF